MIVHWDNKQETAGAALEVNIESRTESKTHAAFPTAPIHTRAHVTIIMYLLYNYDGKVIPYA